MEEVALEHLDVGCESGDLGIRVEHTTLEIVPLVCNEGGYTVQGYGIQHSHTHNTQPCARVNQSTINPTFMFVVTRGVQGC